MSPIRATLGPLRRIEEVLHRGTSVIFDLDRVRLACGHQAQASPGAKRARCRQCIPVDSREFKKGANP
jgi:hypothetical protein